MTNRANVNPLVGTWRLVSCAFHDGRSVNHPYGPDPSGFLTYTPDGQMAVMFGDPDRPLLENPDWRQNVDEDIATAARLCIAYCGTYDLHDDEVAHHVAFSIMPNWIGQTLTRRITLSGDILTLSRPESLVDGRKQTGTLVWKRVE